MVPEMVVVPQVPLSLQRARTPGKLGPIREKLALVVKGPASTTLPPIST